jgi:hypothetical protein
MSQNSVQFQKGMSLDQLVERYGTDSKCEQALEEARWGRGFVCRSSVVQTIPCSTETA